MGCANISQKESIKTKELDINCEIIKTNDNINFTKKSSAALYEQKKTIPKNIQKIKESKSLNNNCNNNKNEKIISGPIINMLKRKVEKYKKNENL